MKILYHHRIASKDGQYVHVEELTRALSERGHEIIMAAPPLAEKSEFGHDGGLVSTLKRHLPPMLYETAEFAYNQVAYRRLARLIRLHRPDFIYERYQLFMPAGVWAARRFRLPLILEVNAPIFRERARYDGIALNRLAVWSERYVWRRADHILPVTRVLADEVRKAGVEGERISVIPNGIDPNRFASAPSSGEAKARLGLSGRLVLGFTGFVREWHGLESVLEVMAVRHEQPLHLLLVGDGPARASLESRARSLGIADRLTLTGIVGRDQIADHVAAFDIALQPAVVSYASPLKLFEYMVLGRAIVAPDQPNMREVLTADRDALLFPPNSKEGLAEAVARLCDDRELRERLGQGAMETIRRCGYTWAANAERVEQIAGRLIGRSIKGGRPGA